MKRPQASPSQESMKVTSAQYSHTAQLLTVTLASVGQRLDNFLLKSCRGVPKSHVYRIIRSGEVRINSGRSSPSCRLENGDVVRVPPLRVASKTIDFSDAESSKLIEKIQHLVGVLYEDDDVLAVNKPAGVASHSGTGNPVGVIEAFRQSSKHNSGAVLELVHRLDRETSGVLLLAKSRPSLTFLQSNLQSDASQKLYLAMLCGGLPTSPLDIDSSLEVTRNQFGVKYCRPGAGKPSRTTFRLLKSFHAYSFVEAELHTGRLHQIRAHAHSIGHPVVCDDLYGTREAHAAALKLGLSRMFLHAHRLSFNHPATNRLMCVEAPLPLDLQRFLNKLK